MPDAGAAQPRGVPLHAVFAVPDFRRLWVIGLVIFGVRWLETTAVGIFVYQEQGSALLVAFMMLLRLVPMALLGAFLGAWAERVERRTALLIMVIGSFGASLALGVLALAEALQVWHLALAILINGVSWAADNPVRRMMLGQVVGADRMSTAMSVDVGTNNASRMLGPVLGGLLLATTGIAGAFLLSALCYLLAIAAALRLNYRNDMPASAGSVLSRVTAGITLVLAERRLMAVMLITLIYNIFAWPTMSMIPVIGQDRLMLGPQGVGVLTSMDGIGAFFGAVIIAWYARSTHYGHLFVGGVASYCAMMVLFALLPHALPSGSALLLAGLGGSGFSIMQTTLVFLATPPEMRSRVLGLLSVCIGVGPLGFVHLGLLADAIGAHHAVALSAAEGLLALWLTRRWWRSLL
ncbi:MFS transporter [Teichococcus vastitatis]|uniref:MFS transporter n=1 Tax=Teichococcus vastitatis TaxID=2307076 RepID=A0ABS9W3C1_9PROT|nr:MFS transporter [Pseudoroseomonas vastitatis]MCI0753069.1 MFS transporter [Pseudoroseomonas vastitatis]